MATRRRNESISQGFYDSKGRFHPIRSADDYDPEAVGEGNVYAKSKKKSKAKKKRKNPRAVIPSRWTTAKVRRNSRGQVQVLIKR